MLKFPGRGVIQRVLLLRPLSFSPIVSPAFYSARFVYCCAAIFSLSGGMIIYALFRNVDSIVLFRFFAKPGFLDGLPIYFDSRNFLVNIFIFQGPNVLWLLSGLFIIRSVWVANKSSASYKKSTNYKWMQIYTISFSLIAIANEISQTSPFVPGTFDILDVFFLSITAFLESMIFTHFIYRRIL